MRNPTSIWKSPFGFPGSPGLCFRRPRAQGLDRYDTDRYISMTRSEYHKRRPP